MITTLMETVLQKINHLNYFVDSTSGTHTRQIENSWREVKFRNSIIRRKKRIKFITRTIKRRMA